MAKVGNLLKKITDPMAIMIRVVELMIGYFFIFIRIFRIFLFF